MSRDLAYQGIEVSSVVSVFRFAGHRWAMLQ